MFRSGIVVLKLNIQREVTRVQEDQRTEQPDT